MPLIQSLRRETGLFRDKADIFTSAAVEVYRLIRGVYNLRTAIRKSALNCELKNANQVGEPTYIMRTESPNHSIIKINSKLNWIDHIKTVTNKLSANIGIIFKVRHNLSSSTLLMLYLTLIQPYCEYCNVVLAAGSSHSCRLYLTSKKCDKSNNICKIQCTYLTYL